jgi:hypothetical protein
MYKTISFLSSVWSRCRQLEMCAPNSFLKGGPHFSKSRNHEKLKSHPKWLEISNKYFKKLNSFFFDLVESNDLKWQDFDLEEI